MPSSSRELAVAYSAAWAAHDPDAILSMHTDDTVFEQHGVAAPAVGREAVHEAISALFEQAPDLAFASRRVHFGAEHFVSEYEMSGTIDGQGFVCDGTDVFTLRDGLIARKDSYVDFAGMLRQLGMEAPAPQQA